VNQADGRQAIRTRTAHRVKGRSFVPVDQLQHVNIRCADAKRSRDFYVRTLGLSEGARPPFASIGYWLYLAGMPVIHLVQRNADAPSTLTGGGAIDHIAFRGIDIDTTRARLRQDGVAFQEAVVPRDGTVQLFVLDPDGVKIELNFETATS
jgi:catechol 2,3-dioxygenase-like lactoylglutathione lyase family enzyme